MAARRHDQLYLLVYAYSFMTLCLLATAQAASLAADSVVAAGNSSSFSPLLEGSFWTSSAGNYTFGFQPIYGGQESAFLLSIWHSEDSNKTAIWWPLASHDVNYDPTVNEGATFEFTSNGSLELRNAAGSLLWSSNTTGTHAALLDTGNLLVYQNSLLDQASWQSFDDSRDSLMLAGLDDNRVSNKPLLLQSRKSQFSYAIGTFHMGADSLMNVFLHKLDQLGNDFIYLYGELHIDGGFSIGRQYGKNYTNNTSLDLKRLSLDYDGNVRVYKWESDVSSWEEKWQFVNSKCMLGSPCGPFGICQVDENSEINCSCPTDFWQRVPGVPSQGCVSPISFNASCAGSALPINGTISYNTTMVEMPHIDYNYNDLHSIEGLGIDECKQNCLDSCANCMAATYNLAERQCFLKGNSELGYLMNGHTTNATILLMKVVKEVQQPDKIVQKDAGSAKKGGGRWILNIGVPIAAVIGVVVVGSIAGMLIWRSTLSTRRENPEYIKYSDGVLRCFSYAELNAATENFSKSLGIGGSGVVYKGQVRNEWGTGTMAGKLYDYAPSEQLCDVAVKLLKRQQYVYSAEFKSELSMLGKVDQYRNIIKLLGYSYRIQRGLKERLLVLEFMENGSLDKYLSIASWSPDHPSAPINLPWRTCCSVALGTARGIAYLHHDCDPPILHRDIKPHNVLLDADFTPKVADFGIAKRFRPKTSHDVTVLTGPHRGTRGYMAPECSNPVSIKESTLKMDVYSFGVLLLELVNGYRQSCAKMPVQQWAIECISHAEMEISVLQAGEVAGVCERDMGTDCPGSNATDEVLQLQELKEKVRLLKVGLWCIQVDPESRPSMSKVVRLIEGTTEMEEPPMIIPLHVESNYSYN